MPKERIRLFLILGVAVLILSAAAFAEETKQSTEVSPEAIEKGIPDYKLNLNQLIKEAERNIKKVDQQLSQLEAVDKKMQEEASLRELMERGNQLYSEGKFKEAKQAWEQALKLTKDPDIKKRIQDGRQKAIHQEAVSSKQEAEQKKQLALKQKEEKRLAAKQALEKKTAYEAQVRKQKLTEKQFSAERLRQEYLALKALEH